MTHSLDTRRTALVAAIREISDPVERYQAVKDVEEHLDLDLKQVKAEIAQTLHDGRPWSKVGELLGVTGSRAEQISRAAR